jgi:hypothetical protein
MIAGRAFLAASAALAAYPCAAFASVSRLALTGSFEQGNLVLGKTEADARIANDGAMVRVSPTGDFAFGFDFDQKSPCAIAARFKDETRETRIVEPVGRQYEIRRITGLPEKLVTLPPEVLERRKRELANRQ